VVEFAASQNIAGVSMRLKPGGVRALHWHPTADERQYYLRGSARVTIFGAHGRAKTEEFGPGQVSFIQQGFGHFVEQVGAEPTESVILFNSPVFEEISISK